MIPASLSDPRTVDVPTFGPTRAASSLQIEHIREVHQLLVSRNPKLARTLDPAGIRTQREVAHFMRAALALLHPELERRDS